MQESEVADQFVEGPDYPVSEDAIVESAREANQPDELTPELNAI